MKQSLEGQKHYCPVKVVARTKEDKEPLPSEKHLKLLLEVDHDTILVKFPSAFSYNEFELNKRKKLCNLAEVPHEMA